MPRQPRLDSPGLLQHVMARGIERTKIFRDDKDRKSFLERFADVLEAAQTQCYAWALIPNHFHALLRTGATPLSKVMRRLMTGYAVTFNKRHKRSGHLFQNRYKSIVCEEDRYLLELIRYIHLNPVRAGLVNDLKELDKYPWSGHSVILGRRKNPLIPKPPKQPNKRQRRAGADQTSESLAEKTKEDVLIHFGDTQRSARRAYRKFVEKGIDQGRRPDLQGGGLVRSARGSKAGLLGRKKEEREKGDERILGSGDFVEGILKEANKAYERRRAHRVSLEELIRKAASDVGLEMEEVRSARRNRKISYVRTAVSYLAVTELGYSAAEVGRKLGISGMGVGKCLNRGEKSLDKGSVISKYLQ